MEGVRNAISLCRDQELYGEEISAPSVQNVDNGIWFARLKDNKTPEFVVDESAFGMAGLWAANGDTYTISSEGAFEFKTLEEPAAPTETGTFLMCSNPNTFTITLKQSAYILTTDELFEQEANPEIKPFQSFVLTDAKTLSSFALYVSAMAWLRVTRRSSR